MRWLPLSLGLSGSNPGEVEKNAGTAGYSYPKGAMNCSSRCEQRWAKD
jgi:hypothetical protein